MPDEIDPLTGLQALNHYPSSTWLDRMAAKDTVRLTTDEQTYEVTIEEVDDGG